MLLLSSINQSGQNATGICQGYTSNRHLESRQSPFIENPPLHACRFDPPSATQLESRAKHPSFPPLITFINNSLLQSVGNLAAWQRVYVYWELFVTYSRGLVRFPASITIRHKRFNVSVKRDLRGDRLTIAAVLFAVGQWDAGFRTMERTMDNRWCRKAKLPSPLFRRFVSQLRPSVPSLSLVYTIRYATTSLGRRDARMKERPREGD